MLALALFALPLWYGFRTNVGTFRAYVPGEELQRLADIFGRDGAPALAREIASQVPQTPRDQVIGFASPSKELLAGNLPAWPPEIPDAAGAYGLVISIGGGETMRVVASHVNLPGGYHLVMGRESVRFESLVQRFWYGIAGAMATVLVLGLAFAWLLRRSILSRVDEISRSATAIMEGDLSRRLPAGPRSGELDKLAQFGQRYALVMKASEDGFWDWIVATDSFYASPRLLEIYGFPPGTTFAGRKDFLARFPVHPEDRPKWAQAVAAHFAGKTARFDIQLRVLRGGETRWIHLTGLAARNAAGEVTRWTGASRDITERKHAEEALRTSEARYARAMDASNDGLWEWNPASDEIFMSKRARQLWAVPDGAEVRTRADLKRFGGFHPEDLQRTEDEIAAASRVPGAHGFDMEYRVIAPGGEVRWVRSQGKAFAGVESGPAVLTGSLTDITERKRAEEALRESEKRYERVMQASEDGFWEWVVATDEFYASPRMLALYGLPPETVFRGRDDFLSRFPFHPEDLGLWREAVAAHLAGKTARVDIEVRAKVQSQTRWIHLTAICQRDASEAEERWTGSVSDVTERRRAQEALQRSEERYARAMEGSDAGHWDWNIVSDAMFVSDRAREMLALPAGALPRSRSDIMALVPMHPEDRAALREGVKAGIDSGVHDRDYRIIPRPGEVRWLRSRAKVYKDARGAAVRMTGSLIDITERKLAADALRASEERYSLAMEASEEGHFDTDLETGEMYISARLNEIYGFPRQAKVANRVEFLKQIPFHPADRHLLADLITPNWDDPARDLYEFECRIVPRPGEMRWIHTRGKVMRDAEGRARRRTGVVADITQRKLAEEALRVSEARNLRIIDAAAVGDWEWDVQRGDYFVSARMRQMLEMPPDLHFASREEFLAHVPFHPEDREAYVEESKRNIAIGSPSLEQEYRVLLKSGAVRWMRLRGKSTRNAQGVVTHFSGSLTDITERKLAAEALRRSEERYSLAMEAAEEGHFDINLDTDEIFTSERFNEIHGFAPGTRFGTRTAYVKQLRFYGNDADTFYAAAKATLAEDAPERYQFEYRILRPSGEMRWIRMRGRVTRDAEGRALRRTGVVADITEAKLAEEARRLSEERYVLAMEAAADGHMDWNLVTGEFYISPRMLRIIGHPPDATFADRADWVRRFPFHPEDRRGWEAAIAEHFAGREAKFRMNVRIVVNGETRWLAFNFIAGRDASGKPVRWTGSIADITGAKRAEEALRESQERYALAVAGSDDGVWDVDFAARRVFISARARELAGMPPGPEMVSIDEWFASLPLHPEDVPRRIAAFQAHLAGETPAYAGEFRLRQPDGIYRWRRLRGLCVRDAKGNPLRMAGSITDVDARRRAEDALRVSDERYALAMEASAEGHFDTDLETDETFISARLAEIYGFPRQARIANRIEWVEQIPFHPDDRQVLAALLRREWEDPTRNSYEFQYRIVPRPGETRWIHTRAMVMRDAEGRARRRTGVVADITERKLAEEALRESEARFRALTELSSDWYWEQDESLRFTYLSGQAQQLTGYSGESSLGKTRWEIVNMTPLTCSWAEHQALLAARQPFRDLECRRIGSDGTVRYLSISGAPVFDAQGEFRGYRGIGRNITARKSAAEAVRESEARFRSLTELSSDWYWRQDEQLRFTYTSRQPEETTAYPSEWVIGKTRWELPGITPLSFTWPQHQAALAAREPFRDLEYARTGLDGTHYVSISGAPVFDDQGVFRGYQGIGRDITERKRIEEALRLSEERYARAMEAADEGHWDWDVVSDEIFVSPRMKQLFGLPADRQFANRSEFFALQPFHPEDRKRLHATVQATLAGPAPHYEMDYRVTPRPGEVRWLHSRGKVFRDADGKTVRVSGSVTDITERKHAEEELRSRQEMLELAQKSARAIAFEWRIGEGEGQNRWSPDLEAMYGLVPGTYDGSFESWKKLVHPEDWPAVKEAINYAQRTGDVDAEYRVLHPDGSVHWLQAKGRMFFDAERNPVRMVGFMHDVTKQRAAEQEFLRMERQLRQAQRLEALGTLAGGIAHDFNNILGAILGYGEMALRDAAKGSRLRRDLDSILVAGERGRALVDRVLAFSRSGVGEHVAIHVEKVVREALDLIAARLPPDVTLHAKLHAGQAALLGDATQVHQVLMNLASNAIQAMPAGGTLRVSLDVQRVDAARALTIGSLADREYLVLKVADTGSGIAPEILERIFDPFFTTKEVGTGTGLGLSLVHGIVTELDGAIEVASRVGAGSTFAVYLPRTGDAPESEEDAQPALPRGDGQRVLVVDDEEPLVKLATRTLEELGYVPVGFTSSAAALAAFRAEPQRFDAVITDERMPGMSGSALIREVRGIRDRIPIMLMSGFIGGTVATRAREAGAEEVLKKPLSARDLATSLARVLHP